MYVKGAVMKTQSLRDFLQTHTTSDSSLLLGRMMRFTPLDPKIEGGFLYSHKLLGRREYLESINKEHLIKLGILWDIVIAYYGYCRLPDVGPIYREEFKDLVTALGGSIPSEASINVLEGFEYDPRYEEYLTNAYNSIGTLFSVNSILVDSISEAIRFSEEERS